MKKILMILVACIFPCNVLASECSNSDRQRLQDLANNIAMTVEEVEYEGSPYLNVTFTGLHKDLKIYNSLGYYYYHNFGDNIVGETTIAYLEPGKVYKFQISGVNNCAFETVRTITLNAPNYNEYYNDSICDGVSDYSLCQKWINIDMTYDEFVKNVKKYKDDFQENTINEDNNNKSFTFYDFYNNYYWHTFFGLLIVLVILIYIWIKQNNKNKL